MIKLHLDQVWIKLNETATWYAISFCDLGGEKEGTKSASGFQNCEGRRAGAHKEVNFFDVKDQQVGSWREHTHPSMHAADGQSQGRRGSGKM